MFLEVALDQEKHFIYAIVEVFVLEAKSAIV